MKKIRRIFMTILAVVMLGGMFLSCVDVDPGEVMVRAWKRGDKAGVVEVLGTSRYNIAIRADDWIFPITKKNYVWTKNPAESSPDDESMTFTIEGLEIGVDIGIEFQVLQNGVEKIFTEYRMKLDGITDGPMRNFVRDALLDEAKTFKSMEQFITNNSINDVIDKVEVVTSEYFRTRGILVTKVYLVNAPRYPATVVGAIEAKIEATQEALRVRNEVEKERSESDKQKIQADADAYEKLAAARADAEANKLRQASYTDAVLRAMWIDKWDGKLPEFVSGEEAATLLMSAQ